MQRITIYGLGFFSGVIASSILIICYFSLFSPEEHHPESTTNEALIDDSTSKSSGEVKWSAVMDVVRLGPPVDTSWYKDDEKVIAKLARRASPFFEDDKEAEELAKEIFFLCKLYTKGDASEWIEYLDSRDRRSVGENNEIYSDEQLSELWDQSTELITGSEIHWSSAHIALQKRKNVTLYTPIRFWENSVTAMKLHYATGDIRPDEKDVTQVDFTVGVRFSDPLASSIEQPARLFFRLGKRKDSNEWNVVETGLTGIPEVIDTRIPRP